MSERTSHPIASWLAGGATVFVAAIGVIGVLQTANKDYGQAVWISIVAFGLLAVAMYLIWRWRHRGAFRWVSLALTLIMATSLGLVLINAKPQGNPPVPAGSSASQTDGSANAGSVPTSGPSTSTKSVSAAVSADASCGPDAQVNRNPPPAEICVIYWCKGSVYSEAGDLSSTSLQLKIGPRITNNSDAPLAVDISKPSTIVLLVSDRDADKTWAPPRKTLAAGDRPRLVAWNGSQYWALPPNVNNDAYDAHNGYYTGFASTWAQKSVAPGNSFLETARNPDGTLVHNGNLVFQLPLDKDANIHPVAIAIVNKATGGVLAAQAFDKWGPSSEPTSF